MVVKVPCLAVVRLVKTPDFWHHFELSRSFKLQYCYRNLKTHLLSPSVNVVPPSEYSKSSMLVELRYRRTDHRLDFPTRAAAALLQLQEPSRWLHYRSPLPRPGEYTHACIESHVLTRAIPRTRITGKGIKTCIVKLLAKRGSQRDMTYICFNMTYATWIYSRAEKPSTFLIYPEHFECAINSYCKGLPLSKEFL